MSEPITNAADAVAALGALPMPVGPEAQPSELERLRAQIAELKAARADEHDELALALGRSNGTEWGDLIEYAAGAVSAEAKSERHRAELVALRNDALNMRGALSPNGQDRKVPMPLGATLLPAVEWLIGRVAELEAERHVTNEALDDAVQELRTPYAERARRETHPGRRQAWRMLAQCEESERVANALLTPEAERSADKLTRMLAPTQPLQPVEGEHYAAVHRDYRKGRDLPETGGA